MHISERVEVKIAAIDPTILERISEHEVGMWLVARLAQLRGTVRANNIQLEADHRTWAKEEYYDFNWSLHGVGEIAMTHKSTESAARDLRERIMGNPTDKAAQKRAEARRALAEAEELEAAARG